MPLHVLLAAIRHETNSFSPLPTPFEAFFPDGEPVMGHAVLAAHDGAKTAFGGLLGGARASGRSDRAAAVRRRAALGPRHRGNARPADRAAPAGVRRAPGRDAPRPARGDDARRRQRRRGADPARRSAPAGRRCRSRWRSTFHANLAQEVVDLATIVCGYRTYPHVDAYETGLRAARLLFATITGRLSPAQALCRVPVLPQMLRQVTDDEPMRSANALAQALTDGRDVVDVSVFGGFPLADSPVTGPSVLVVGGAGRAAAAAAARRIAAVLWESRARLVDAGAEPVADTLARAAALPPPVILADCGNNAGAGGTCDTMTVLAAMLAAGMRDIVAGVYWDPAAVDRAATRAPGRGRHRDHRRAPPLCRRSHRAVAPDRTRAPGHRRPVPRAGSGVPGMLIELGTCVVFDAGAATLLVAERRIEGFDAGMFTHAGVDPAAARYVLVFSRVGYRAGFARYGESRAAGARPGGRRHRVRPAAVPPPAPTAVSASRRCGAGVG